ncbi:hypothetical protein GCM10023340_33360 [Nocardioides marinquilinus]|uniref:Sulfatase N-terminal domain-containing protein n=1 Tax=Nocardioides marinquilinus TaxID=1210400 RepID=A0ABP9PVH5_9ACTN
MTPTLPSPARPTRRGVLRGAAATGALGTVGALTLTAPASAAAARRPGARRPPNVVVVSIDDLGWDELGCYGNTFNETPHIDALAAAGVRFTQAYAAAPLCSPTRAALVTGRYPARVGITDFLRGPDAPSDTFLSPDVPTVPDHLGPLGYTTGLIGKWHLTETYRGEYAERPGNPFAHGFDEVVASEQLYIGDGDYVHPYGFMPALPAREPGEYLTDRLAQEAVDFVTRHAAEPFFVHLSNYAVHTRLDGKPELVAKYAAKPGADALPNRPQLAAMLESIDQQVGALVAALEALGIAEDTLLVVVSDNGGPYRDANAPLRGGKGELYEGGIRVPMVVSWPGRTGRPGRDVDVPASTVDLLPTALDLAGGRAHPGAFDGVSLAPVLTGAGRLRRETLFWVYPHHIGQSHPQAAVRDGDLKLVMHLRDGRCELFGLRDDPGETTDVSAERPHETRRLQRLLERHLREVDVLPPAPSRPAYPRTETLPGWDGYDVLTVAGTTATPVVEPDGDRVRVAADGAAHVLLRSPVAPRSDQVAVVLEPAAFDGAARQESLFVGLAAGPRDYLVLRYRHDLRRVGWDLRVAGELITAGAEPLQTLDGTVDLSGPGARYGFVLRGAQAAAWVDQGRGAGWEFLFRFDTAGAFDLADPALRATTRYAAGVRVDRSGVVLGRLTASSR